MKYLVVLIFVAIVIFLVYVFHAKKEDVFKDNYVLSEVRYEGIMGKDSIINDPTRPTVIVWFHPECEHCRYQLDVLNKNIRQLGDARFFFITAERDYFQKNFSIAWPDLVQSPHVSFGIIEKSRFINEFGPVVTPSLLLFNHGGILKEKLYGEVKVEKILQLIKKHPVPEQTMSGHN